MVTGLSLVLVTITSGAFARSLRDRSDDSYAYVFVTGSHIPQKLKIKHIGTTTYSDLRVYNRHEIDRTGRTTVEGVLATDPSLQVHMNGAGPGN
jgi:outer membrane cobalamin receptor